MRDSCLTVETSSSVSGALLSEVIQGLRLAHGDRPGITFAADRSCRVRASKDRLAQVFENVLANARSFSPAQKNVEVSVVTGERRCFARIADRGPGIPAEHLDRVFDRFFSYRPSGSHEPVQHAGLGLSIARTVVNGYGGTIVAANRADGGACFEITLPEATAR